MPRGKGNASSTARPVEPEKQNESEKPVDSDERVDLDVDNDPEEVMEEDVEYEEVEEEEEVEEIEEVEEEEEEEEVEEEEVEEEDVEGVEDGGNNDNGINAQNENGIDEDEKKKHDELLALPPHGSEVYIGGIPQDTSEEDLRSFCVSIGEVTEVIPILFISYPDYVVFSGLTAFCFKQVRIMKSKDSNENKGFAFVTYKSVELASKAIDGLNNTEFKVAFLLLFIVHTPISWYIKCKAGS